MNSWTWAQKNEKHLPKVASFAYLASLSHPRWFGGGVRFVSRPFLGERWVVESDCSASWQGGWCGRKLVTWFHLRARREEEEEEGGGVRKKRWGKTRWTGCELGEGFLYLCLGRVCPHSDCTDCTVRLDSTVRIEFVGGDWWLIGTCGSGRRSDNDHRRSLDPHLIVREHRARQN